VKKVGKDVATFSPVVTLEPRRRRFHQPVTLTMPLPPPLDTNTAAASTAAATEPSSEEIDPDNVRLLCSLTGKQLRNLRYGFYTTQHYYYSTGICFLFVVYVYTDLQNTGLGLVT